MHSAHTLAVVARQRAADRRWRCIPPRASGVAVSQAACLRGVSSFSVGPNPALKPTRLQRAAYLVR